MMQTSFVLAALLARPTSSMESYEKVPHRNCWGGRGGNHFPNMPRNDLTAEECKAACSNAPGFSQSHGRTINSVCDGVVIAKHGTKPECFLIKNLIQDDCDNASSWSDLWVAVGRSNPLAYPVGIEPIPLMHMMPWFNWGSEGSKDSGKWGLHWQMNSTITGGPSILRPAGKIAAHMTPLIGPYSSADSKVVEWQLALMRDAGIEGVVIDWYGTRAARDRDYQLLLDASDQIINQASAMDPPMKFTVCYEDATSVSGTFPLFDSPIDEEREPPEPARTLGLAQMVADFEYIRDHYMSKEGFLTDNEGAPVILVFGPRNFQNRSDWSEVLDVVFAGRVRPVLLTLPPKWDYALNSLADGVGDGVFKWDYALNSSADEATQLTEAARSLSNFYTSYDPIMGSAFPGFHDFYVEGEGRTHSFGYLPDYNGRSLEVAFHEAKMYKPQFLQLATWNDYGEGTAFEPTRETLGTPASHFRRLLDLQTHLNPHRDEAEAEASFLSTTCDLWSQIAYDHPEWPALDPELCPPPEPWSCDTTTNFINGAAYSQQSLTDYCPACSANPVYEGPNDHEEAVAYCKAKCEAGVWPATSSCVGFFYQRHMNGHEICGFYNTAPDWDQAVGHGHSAGSRTCKLTRGSRRLEEPRATGTGAVFV